MPVDPNELLIFKMRGMKAKPKKPEKAQAIEPAQVIEPQPARHVEEIIAPA